MPPTKQALVVEEDQTFAVELETLLGSLGFSVTCLPGPDQALETLGTRQYEVAMLDMRLPDMTWRATSRTVKGLSRTTRVIMMARSVDEQDVRLTLNAGAYVVLDRPLAREQVAGLISSQSEGLLVVVRG